MYLLERQYSPEPRLSAQHMIEALLSIFQWELLNHAVDIMDLREVDCLLTVEAVSRWPSLD